MQRWQTVKKYWIITENISLWNKTCKKNKWTHDKSKQNFKLAKRANDHEQIKQNLNFAEKNKWADEQIKQSFKLGIADRRKDVWGGRNKIKFQLNSRTFLTWFLTFEEEKEHKSISS